MVSERQLKVFQLVVRTGSFTEAAIGLCMTQPAVSFQIRKLEQALKCRLIDRSTRAMSLTAEGEMVLAYAERILGLHEELKQQVAALNRKPG